MMASICRSLLPLTAWPRAVIRPRIELACLANLLRLARQRACRSALGVIISFTSPAPQEGGLLRNPCQALRNAQARFRGGELSPAGSGRNNLPAVTAGAGLGQLRQVTTLAASTSRWRRCDFLIRG